MGVDDRRHSIGRVMEAVDEFEAERNHQREAKQQHRTGRKTRNPGTREIMAERINNKHKTGGEQTEKSNRTRAAHT